MDGSARIAQSMKDRKTKFVSDLTGGSVWEINVVCSAAPVAFLCWSVLQSRYRVFESQNLQGLVIDFLLNVGALLVATTIYSDYPGLLLALMTIPAIFIYLTKPALSPSPSRVKAKADATMRHNKVSASSGKQSPFPIRPYLTAYRAGMLIITAICILAVDFHVFPRRFGKAETWGTSLMDVGVGSFVFSGGMMSAKSILKTRMALSSRAIMLNKGGLATEKATLAVQDSVQADSLARKEAGLLLRLANALRASMPLLILGAVRLYSVKGLDYAEHVSEYGVHWNFFFTLGFIPLGMALLEPLLAALPPRLPGHLILGFVVMVVDGLALDINATGLRAWVLTAPRVDLLSQNREGIVSLAGYLAIFLLGIEAGTVLLPSQPVAGLGAFLSPTGTTTKEPIGSPKVHRQRTLLALATGACLYGGLAWLLVNPIFKGWTSIASPISRRIANPPYVLWIAAFNHLQLFLYALVETLIFPGVHTARTVEDEKREASNATSTLLNSFNAGGLGIFLLSNLGTGLVNLTVNTLDASNTKAMGILSLYMLACSIAAVGLTRAGIKLKL